MRPDPKSILSALLAVIAAAALCSCGLQDLPVKGCVTTNHGTVCYDSRDGFTAAVDARSGK